MRSKVRCQLFCALLTSVAVSACSGQSMLTSPSLASSGGNTPGGSTTVGPVGLVCAVNVPEAQRAWPVGSNGAEFAVSFTANGECGWTASVDATFLTLLSPASGAGNGSIEIRVAANTGDGRAGTITIGSTAIAVVQEGAPAVVAPPPATGPNGWIGPITPPPPPGAASYFTLQSAAGDPVGLGQAFAETAVSGQTRNGPSVVFFAGRTGDGTPWTLQVMNATADPLVAGTASDAANTEMTGGLGRAGLLFTIGGRRCDGAARFEVREAEFGSAAAGSELKRFRVAFEERCNGATANLVGEVAFTAP